jgi:hypothetical protein
MVDTVEEACPVELRALLLRGQAGDITARPAIRAAFGEHPELAKLLGDPGHLAQEALLSLCAGDDVTAREALARRLDEARQELAGAAASLLEKLLIQRVVLNHLPVAWAEPDLAARLGPGLRD